MRVTIRIVLALTALGLVSCVAVRDRRAVPTVPSAAGLLGTEWRLQDIGGIPVIASSDPTLTFPQPGKIGGNASCNRFAASVVIADATVRVTDIATTRRSCSDALTTQEGKYLPALEGAARLETQGPFLLIYSKRSDKPLRFRRTKPPPNE